MALACSWALVALGWLVRPAGHGFPADGAVGRLSADRRAVPLYRLATLLFLAGVLVGRLDAVGLPSPTPLMLLWPYWWWWLGSSLVVFLPAALAFCAAHPPSEL